MAEDAVSPGAIGQAQGGELLAPLFGQKRTLPVAPAARTDDPRTKILLRPGQSGKHAPGRGGIIQFQVKFITRRCGIEQYEQPVGAAQLALGPDHGAAIADVGARYQVNPPRLPRHPPGTHDPLGNCQPVNLQPIDPDIEIGQDRRIGIAGIELRAAQQDAAACHQLADIEAAAQPVQRAPVELHHGHPQERSLGIGQGDIVQHRHAIQRPLDPPDF